MNRVLQWVCCGIFLLQGMTALATHNRAGEITYEHVSGYTYKATITTYTKISSPADRPWLHIYWGDEPAGVLDTELDSLPRSSEVFYSSQDTKQNIYIGYHTYAGPGIYTMMVIDPNRNSGVVNIINSVQQVFSIQTMLTISPSTGHNNSVVLQNPPLQDACLYQNWYHNPAAYDADGDSIAYHLVPCLGEGGLPLSLGDFPAWVSPEQSSPQTTDTFVMDANTGNITWSVPLLAGEYNIAFRVLEYRNGMLIGFVTRDMQITVITCNNQPPVIAAVPDKCVLAGESVQFQVNATDPNADLITLQAFGGPMDGVENTAVFNPNTGNFAWYPQCLEIQQQPYQVTFIATDDGYVNLSDFETVNITVVAPRVENMLAQSQGNAIAVSWDMNSCASALTAYQQGLIKYLVYRRNGTYGFTPDVCELGVPSYTGYTYVGSVTGANNTTYLDQNVTFGPNYCYMVVTRWIDGALSYASEEVCAQLQKKFPVITQVSVVSTSTLSGRVDVAWSAPNELDTLSYAGPYYYQVYYGPSGSAVNQLVYTTPVSNYFFETDTTFTHLGLNTQDQAHVYRVQLISNATSVGYSSVAASPFLNLTALDNAVQIQVVENVPWDNIRYRYYRKGPLDVNYSFWQETNSPQALDDSLINNKTYCYKVECIGTYGLPHLDSLINWSQEDCTNPYDHEPPCDPTAVLEGDCMTGIIKLTWNKPTCADDITGYHIYHNQVLGDPWTLIAETDNADDTIFVYNEEGVMPSIAGCWVVTAVDSLNLWPDGEMHQNESSKLDSLCIDNCPYYALPNIFSPNGDLYNDTYDAFPYRYIDHVEMKIFNQWGSLMYETEEPAIQWNGTDYKTGKLCPDGVFFYAVNVYEIRLTGLEMYTLHGTIELVDGKVISIAP